MKDRCFKWILLSALLGGLGVVPVACKEKESRSKASAKDSRPVLEAFDSPQDERSRAIEALTGGHTRIVWAQQQDREKLDKYANGRKHKLLGFGTRDGSGERVILGEVGNYSRPLLTPDGKRVVYTEKGVSKVKDSKSYDPRCYVVDWDGSGKRELADAYADDLWLDPETGITWVYAVEDMPDNKQIAMWGKTLVRFQLDAPKVREVIYAEGDIAVNNLQASRDGTRIASLFPWPHAGMLHVGKKSWESIGTGCWTSMCPDNSYLAWVFDGAHKNVMMVHPDSNQKWIVSMSNLPEFQNKEMYHPRWSNDPRFFGITGYYSPGSKNGAGKHVEVYIGKFDEGMTKVAAWAKVTANKNADIFPDVWVEGGEQVSLDGDRLGEAAPGEPEVVKGKVRETEAETWPANAEGLVFAWESAAKETKIGAHPCRLALHGRARFGRYHDAVLGGGTAVPDADSLAALASAGPASTLEFLLTAESAADGVVYSDGVRTVFVTGGRIYAKAGESLVDGGEIEAGKPTHLAVAVEGGATRFFRDGAPVLESADIAVPETGTSLRFGDGTWEGRVSGIGIYARVLSDEEVAANAATWAARVAERKPAAPVVLKGKLVEMTPLKTKTEIGAYNRALAVYAYEVEEVLDGDYMHERALVNHWYYMDDIFLASMPREIGKSYELRIEPAAEHPEIGSELTDDDGVDFETPVYFDVTTPEP